jgi:hypothetical protein
MELFHLCYTAPGGLPGSSIEVACCNPALIPAPGVSGANTDMRYLIRIIIAARIVYYLYTGGTVALLCRNKQVLCAPVTALRIWNSWPCLPEKNLFQP